MAIRCALLTISTKGDPVADETVDSIRILLGQLVADLVFVDERQTASDRHLIEDVLRRWSDEEDMDLILTIGGTFPAPGHSGHGRPSFRRCV